MTTMTRKQTEKEWVPSMLYRTQNTYTEFSGFSCWELIVGIVTDTLGYHKVCAQQVAKMLTKITEWHLHVLVSTSLTTKEANFFFQYRHWWWNVAFIHQCWVETTIHAVASFWFTWTDKIQTNPLSKENHGNCILGPKRCAFDWFYGTWNNHYISSLLWNTS